MIPVLNLCAASSSCNTVPGCVYATYWFEDYDNWKNRNKGNKYKKPPVLGYVPYFCSLQWGSDH